MRNYNYVKINGTVIQQSQSCGGILSRLKALFKRPKDNVSQFSSITVNSNGTHVVIKNGDKEKSV